MSTINGASAPAVKSCLNGSQLDFKDIAKAALSQSTLLLERWLPGGRWEGHEYVVKNPARPDGSPGSFKINAKSGKWSDFASSEGGGDLIDLRAFIDHTLLIDAARAIAGELAISTSTKQGVTLEAYASAKSLSLQELRALGLEAIQNPYHPDQMAVAIPYHDTAGIVTRVRYRVAMLGKNKLVWDRQKEKAISLYGLERLPDADRGELYLVEGESDCHTLWQRGYAALGIPGATNFNAGRDDKALNGFEVVALIEPDAGGEAMLARLRKSKHASRIRVAHLDGFKDTSDLHCKAPERFDAVLKAAIQGAKPLIETQAKPDAKNKTKRIEGATLEEDDRKPTQADTLVRLAGDAASFFKSPDDTAYALVEADGHREVWPLRSTGFKQWLVYRYFRATGIAPKADALGQALCTLGAMAQFDGETAPVFTRTASQDGKLYLDLCDDTWRAVEISAEGWRIVNEPPVRFIRSKGMLALPEPLHGGSMDALRPLLNVAAEDDFKLIVGWLLAALRPRGPFPLLALCGEAGSAKSTAAKVLRSLVDPNAAPLRSTPRDERDLFISAANSACLVLDNLSSISATMSDALCRVATGGSFSTKTLYTDTDETLIDVCRPVLLTSVGEVIARSDLADRTVLVTLASISETRRLPDDEFAVMLETARPRILGALLDAIAAGLRELPAVRLDRLPRMANFIRWTRACEVALWEPGSIQAAFDKNMAEAVDGVLEGDPVAMSLLAMLDKQPGRCWQGRGSELLTQLSNWAPEGALRERSWPRNPQTLTSRLTLAAPSLRKKGIVIERGKSNGERWVSIRQR